MPSPRRSPHSVQTRPTACSAARPPPLPCVPYDATLALVLLTLCLFYLPAQPLAKPSRLEWHVCEKSEKLTSGFWKANAGRGLTFLFFSRTELHDNLQPQRRNLETQRFQTAVLQRHGARSCCPRPPLRVDFGVGSVGRGAAQPYLCPLMCLAMNRHGGRTAVCSQCRFGLRSARSSWG